MKDYLVFIGNVYYAAGGMHDFVRDFDTQQEAVDFIKEKVLDDDSEWGHVYCLSKTKIVFETYKQAYS